MISNEILKQYPAGASLQAELVFILSSYGSPSTCAASSADYFREQGYLILTEPFVITANVRQDFNPVQQAVESIDQKLSKLADAYYAEQARLQEQRKQLLQITFDSDEVLAADPTHAPKDIDDDIPF